MRTVWKRFRRTKNGSQTIARNHTNAMCARTLNAPQMHLFKNMRKKKKNKQPILELKSDEDAKMRLAAGTSAQCIQVHAHTNARNLYT